MVKPGTAVVAKCKFFFARSVRGNKKETDKAEKYGYNSKLGKGGGVGTQ